ncbi:MAG: glycosyltransferase [Clostridia bacterium]|nr:glycosyltransferase [Clostridia bacterium]
MSKGTVIYYGGFVLPDKNAAANRVVSNGKLFASLGYDTVFIGASASEDSFVGLRKVGDRDGMFEFAHPQSTSQWLKHMTSVEHIQTVMKNHSDVKKIILYNVPMLTLLKAKAVFSKKNIDVCYDCTEWTKDTDGSFAKRVFKSFDEILIRNFAHKVADSMIVISRMMEKKYRKAKNLLLLPPLVDINDAVWHQDATHTDGIFEFCFAGIPDGNKESLDKVAEAFAMTDNNSFRLKIIGITEEDYRRIYPDCHIGEDAMKRISFLGRVSHAEVIRHILGCDCYIFIRRSDRRNNAGFPTKFAESYTCAVPIITTDVSDVGEYIKNSGRGILLNDLSADKIARAMLIQSEKKCIAASPDTAFHYETYISSAEEWMKQ